MKIKSFFATLLLLPTAVYTLSKEQIQDYNQLCTQTPALYAFLKDNAQLCKNDLDPKVINDRFEEAQDITKNMHSVMEKLAVYYKTAHTIAENNALFSGQTIEQAALDDIRYRYVKMLNAQVGVDFKPVFDNDTIKMVSQDGAASYSPQQCIPDLKIWHRQLRWLHDVAITVINNRPALLEKLQKHAIKETA